MSNPDDPYAKDRPPHDQPPTAPQPGHGQPAQGYSQPAGYGEPAQGYGDPAAGGYGHGAPPRNGLGTTALVLGIVGLLLAFIPVIGILGALLGIVGIVLGFMGRGRVKRGEATNGGVALTGIILSFLAVLITIGYVVLFSAIFGQVEDCTTLPTQAEQQACIEEELGG